MADQSGSRSLKISVELKFCTVGYIESIMRPSRRHGRVEVACQ